MNQLDAWIDALQRSRLIIRHFEYLADPCGDPQLPALHVDFPLGPGSQCPPELSCVVRPGSDLAEIIHHTHADHVVTTFLLSRRAAPIRVMLTIALKHNELVRGRGCTSCGLPWLPLAWFKRLV